MKKQYLLVLLFLPFNANCQTQLGKTVPRDSTGNYFDLFWKIEKELIIEEFTEGDYFYRAIALPLSEEESNLEGEALYEVYLLKGEYGEYPEGKLVSVGRFYKITSMIIEPQESQAILKVSHGIKGEVAEYLIE
jgi:hypothetical protein